MNEKIEKKKGAITMYNENDYNKYQGGGSRQDQNTDSDLDYTEGSYSDSTSSRQTDSRYSGYHDSRYTGNAEGRERSEGTYQDRKPDRSYIPQEPGRNGKRAVTWLKGQRESRRRELFLAV